MKKLFLFTLICSLGFFTACSDDDDNDTPTPTPPEVNLAKEIEGLYNADLFLTYDLPKIPPIKPLTFSHKVKIMSN